MTRKILLLCLIVWLFQSMTKLRKKTNTMLVTDIKSLPLYICKLFVVDDMEHCIISWSDKNLYL